MLPVAFRLDGRERHVLWIAGENGEDEVSADGDRVRVFDTLQELHQYAAATRSRWRTLTPTASLTSTRPSSGVGHNPRLTRCRC